MPNEITRCTTPQSHIVIKDETLKKIAHDRLISAQTACGAAAPAEPTDAEIMAEVRRLQQINPSITNPDKIWVGQTIKFFRPPPQQMTGPSMVHGRDIRRIRD